MTNYWQQLTDLYPDFTGEEWHEVLWEATAFPACDADHTIKQVRAYRDAGFKTADSILSYAYWLLEFEMRLYQPRLQLVPA